MSRKLEEKQARRLAEKKRKAQQRREARRRNLVTIGTAVLVLALVVFFIYQEQNPGSKSGPIGVSLAQAGCTDIETHEDEGRSHEDPATPLTYGSSPPTSGAHYGVTSDPGFFSSPVQPGQLVHNMEHGHVIIWYRPDASDAVKDGLERYIDETKHSSYVMATPYDQLEGDFSYAMTAWNKSQSCDKLSGEAIDAFRKRFQGRGPEQVGTPPF